MPRITLIQQAKRLYIFFDKTGQDDSLSFYYDIEFQY